LWEKLRIFIRQLLKWLVGCSGGERLAGGHYDSAVSIVQRRYSRVPKGLQFE
jgi:hypothetical protein